MAKPAAPSAITHMSGVYKLWFEYRDNFPKKCRYTLAEKVDAYMIRVLELLNMAAYQSPAEKLPTLERAIIGIDTIKFFVKLTWEIGALDDKKFEIVSSQIDEVGRQVGGWVKGLREKVKTPTHR